MPPTEPLLPSQFPVAPFVPAPPLDDPAALRRHADALGYLFFRDLLPAGVVAELRAFVRGECERLGWVEPEPDNPPVFRVRPGARLTGHGWDDPDWVALQRAVRLHPTFRALAGCAEVRAVFAALWDEPPLLATANMSWVKLPGSPAQTTRPHQDRFYLRDVPRFWTLWVPLVDTPFEVGPLAVVRGSPARGLVPHVDNLTGIAVPTDLPWDSAEVHPGDAVFFGELTVHCAWSNVSPTRVRASFDIRYEPQSAGPLTALHPAEFEGLVCVANEGK